jgi:nicotinamidase-related amidase
MIDSSHLCGGNGRYAAELGYEVTMLRDATADYSDEEMHAALDVNIPNYASAM